MSITQTNPNHRARFDYDKILSNENDAVLKNLAMSMLVRQAMAAQPPMDDMLEEEMQDREKRGKIFLPTLF